VVAALVGIAMCQKFGASPPALDAGASVEPPAKMPEDLLAEFSVPSPNASWTRLQRGIGGAVGILPATLPGVLVALTDLDVDLGNELDGTAPMYGVIAGDPSDPSVLAAVRLVDARRARALLVEGETARFGAKDVDGTTLLVPSRPSSGRRFEVALTQNGYLVVTRRVTDLGRLAPYVTRTLPGRSLPPKVAAVIDVPGSALRTTIKGRLASLWAESKSFLLAQDQRMRAERGRAPDFGDPAAIVATVDGVLTRRIDIIGNLDSARIVLDVAEDALVADTTLVPAKETGPARLWVEGMKVGDAAGVLALQADAALAVGSRDADAQRAEQSNEVESAIRAVLGSRLKDSSKLHEVFEEITKARDESLAFAVTLEDPPGAILRAPVRDSAAVDKAIRGAFDLTKTDPFKELLRVREVAAKSDELPGVGRVSTLMIARDTKDPKRHPESAGVAWAVDAKTLVLGAGPEPLVTLRLGAKPERRLAEEPSLLRFVAAIGSDASTVMIAQPLRLDPKRANLPTAPLAIAVGKKGGDATVRVDIADGLFRELARWQMGF
jgi:hypothetical protein